MDLQEEAVSLEILAEEVSHLSWPGAFRLSISAPGLFVESLTSSEFSRETLAETTSVPFPRAVVSPTQGVLDALCAEGSLQLLDATSKEKRVLASCPLNLFPLIQETTNIVETVELQIVSPPVPVSSAQSAAPSSVPSAKPQSPPKQKSAKQTNPPLSPGSKNAQISSPTSQSHAGEASSDSALNSPSSLSPPSLRFVVKASRLLGPREDREEWSALILKLLLLKTQVPDGSLSFFSAPPSTPSKASSAAPPHPSPSPEIPGVGVDSKTKKKAPPSNSGKAVSGAAAAERASAEHNNPTASGAPSSPPPAVAAEPEAVDGCSCVWTGEKGLYLGRELLAMLRRCVDETGGVWIYLLPKPRTAAKEEKKTRGKEKAKASAATKEPSGAAGAEDWRRYAGRAWLPLKSLAMAASSKAMDGSSLETFCLPLKALFPSVFADSASALHAGESSTTESHEAASANSPAQPNSSQSTSAVAASPSANLALNGNESLTSDPFVSAGSVLKLNLKVLRRESPGNCAHPNFKLLSEKTERVQRHTPQTATLRLRLTAALFVECLNLGLPLPPSQEKPFAAGEGPAVQKDELFLSLEKVRRDAEGESCAVAAAKEDASTQATFNSKEVELAALLAVDFVSSAALALTRDRSEEESRRLQLRAASQAAPCLLKFTSTGSPRALEERGEAGQPESFDGFFEELLRHMRQEGSLEKLQEVLRGAVRSCLRLQVQREVLLAKAAAVASDGEGKPPAAEDCDLLLHRKSRVLAEAFSKLTDGLNVQINKIAADAARKGLREALFVKEEWENKHAPAEAESGAPECKCLFKNKRVDGGLSSEKAKERRCARLRRLVFEAEFDGHSKRALRFHEELSLLPCHKDNPQTLVDSASLRMRTWAENCSAAEEDLLKAVSLFGGEEKTPPRVLIHAACLALQDGRFREARRLFDGVTRAQQRRVEEKLAQKETTVPPEAAQPEGAPAEGDGEESSENEEPLDRENRSEAVSLPSLKVDFLSSDCVVTGVAFFGGAVASLFGGDFRSFETHLALSLKPEAFLRVGDLQKEIDKLQKQLLRQLETDSAVDDASPAPSLPSWSLWDAKEMQKMVNKQNSIRLDQVALRVSPPSSLTVFEDLQFPVSGGGVFSEVDSAEFGSVAFLLMLLQFGLGKLCLQLLKEKQLFFRPTLLQLPLLTLVEAQALFLNKKSSADYEFADYRESGALFSKLLKTRTPSSYCCSMAAECFLKAASPSREPNKFRALELLQSATKLCEQALRCTDTASDPALRIRAGQIALRNAKFALAESFFQSAIAASPTTPAFVGLALSHFRLYQRETSEATREVHLEKAHAAAAAATALNENCAEAWVLLALCGLQKKAFSQAEACTALFLRCESAASLGSDTPCSAPLLGRISLESKFPSLPPLCLQPDRQESLGKEEGGRGHSAQLSEETEGTPTLLDAESDPQPLLASEVEVEVEVSAPDLEGVLAGVLRDSRGVEFECSLRLELAKAHLETRSEYGRREAEALSEQEECHDVQAEAARLTFLALEFAEKNSQEATLALSRLLTAAECTLSEARDALRCASEPPEWLPSDKAFFPTPEERDALRERHALAVLQRSRFIAEAALQIRLVTNPSSAGKEPSSEAEVSRIQDAHNQTLDEVRKLLAFQFEKKTVSELPQNEGASGKKHVRL